MVQYNLMSYNKIMFPRTAKYYILCENEEGKLEGKVVETPNTPLLGIKFDVCYDIEKNNIFLP